MREHRRVGYRCNGVLYALYCRRTTVVVQANAKHVPTLGQETTSVPWTPGGRAARRQSTGPSVVAAAKAPLGPLPFEIDTCHLLPMAQQPLGAKHEMLHRAPPGGRSGPASIDQERPPPVAITYAFAGPKRAVRNYMFEETIGRP
jgi:hypothetical protein